MICRRCGTTNADEKEFCRRCGGSLHWEAIAGPGNERKRQGLVGLCVGVAVLSLGVLLAYRPAPFALAPFGASPSPSTPVAATATAASRANGSLAPAAGTQEPARNGARPGGDTGQPNSDPRAGAPAPAAGSAPQLAVTPSSGATDPVAPLTAAVVPADAEINYTSRMAPVIVQVRTALSTFSARWSAPDGFAARLRSEPGAQSTAAVTQNVEQTKAQIDTASTALRQQKPPPALQLLQNSILQAIDSANSTLAKAESVARNPEPNGIGEVALLLTQADQNLGRAAKDLDAIRANLRPSR